MDSSWRQTVNYQALNKVVAPTTSPVPEMVLIVQKYKPQETGHQSRFFLNTYLKRVKCGLLSHGKDPNLHLLCCHRVI